jgi:hypothetical protein
MIQLERRARVCEEHFEKASLLKCQVNPESRRIFRFYHLQDWVQMLASTSKRTLQCRCLSSSITLKAQAATRAVHTRPNLPYDISGGLKPFLSSQALRGTAVEWHQGNLNKLNDLIRGGL